MNEQLKVSIILPVYNAEKTLERAINSVINQTYKNIELIVIENGEKKETEEICKKFQVDNEYNIKYVYNSVANVSKARNMGLQNATGKYIAFIDADDKYEKDFIEKLINCMEENDLQLIACGYKTSNGKIERLIDKSESLKTTANLQGYLEKLKQGLLFNELWNKIYLNSIIKEKKVVFNEEFELGEDFLFNLDYYKWVSKAGYINEPLYIYTEGQEGLKLKYRKNKFEIEYELTKYMENLYLEKDYSMEYIYNQYARIYYNAILNIYQKNNPCNKNEKNEQLKEFINSERYKNDLNYLKNKITDKKFKIAVKYFFLKGSFRIKVFLLLHKLIHN